MCVLAVEYKETKGRMEETNEHLQSGKYYFPFLSVSALHWIFFFTIVFRDVLSSIAD